MNLYKELPNAYNNACTRYFKSKSEDLIYVFPCKISRQEFYTIMSEKEAKEYKVPLTKAIYTFGDTESCQKIKADLKAKLSDPKIKEHDAYVRYLKTLQQNIRAEKRLEKLKAANK
jgi:hypothetical protein